MTKEENKIVLSISLIVKNEEKNLARCLDSLQTLMSRIPCQLIITDTGSTDNTVEIAKKYTDEVYFFEWCNDFAAARNYGLEKSVGEWFMFIDADEYFENTLDIEKFFLSGEYKKYKGANHIVRNYHSVKSRKGYNDTTAGRLFENKGIKFYGKIHEYINVEGPCTTLLSFTHHYSYASDHDKEFIKQKSHRNMTMLEEAYLQNSEDIRTAYHLSLEYAKAKRLIKYRDLISEWYERIKCEKSNLYLPYFAIKRAASLYDMGDTDGATEVIKNYMETRISDRLWDIDFYLLWAKVYHRQKSYEEAMRLCDKGLELFKKKAEGTMTNDPIDYYIMPTNINYEGEGEFIEIKAHCHMEMGNIEEAIETFKSINIVAIPNNNYGRVLNVYLNLLVKEKRCTDIVEVCKQLYIEDSHERFEEMLSILERKLGDTPELIKEISTLISKETQFEEEQTSAMISLYKFRGFLTDNPEGAKQEIRSVYTQLNSDRLDSSKSEYLLGILLGSEEARQMLDVIDIDDLHEYIAVISRNCDYVDKLLEHWININEAQLQNIKEAYFILCLFEGVILNEEKAANCNLELMYEAYVLVGQQYIYSIYSEHVLNEENILMLPRSIRFIYFAGMSNAALDQADPLLAVKLLKEGLKHYPVMNKVVERRLDAITLAMEEQSEQEKARAAEFSQQAQLIKAKIVEIANMGMRDQAIELLNSYKQINPADTEGIKELERALSIDN